MENWLLLAVGIVFLVCMIAGFVKGFLRIGLSLLSTILTLVLVSFLSPYVSDALMKHTPAQDVTGEEDSGSIYARAFSR